MRRLLIGGADLIKCIGTGAVLTRGGVPGAPELSEDELRAAVEEAGYYGKFVAVHAHSSEGARRAIRAGARSVEHGSMLDDDTIAMLADTGTFFSVDLYDGEWALEHGEAERWPAETMRKLARDDGDGHRGLRARPSSAASASPTGPTAASTRTTSSRSSSRGSSGAG